MQMTGSVVVTGVAGFLPPRRLVGSFGAFALGLVMPLLLNPAYAAEPRTGHAPDAAPEALTEAGPPEAASPARMRLISQQQYFNSIAYVFGPDVSVAASFAPFRRTDGLLANGGAAAGVTSGQMQEFQRTAAALADKVVSLEHRNFLVPCTPVREDAADKACATQFLEPLGRLLYRRPMSSAQLAVSVAQAGEAADRLKDFYAGLAVALEGVLVAPDTLFILDTSEPDPDHPGRSRLDGYSLASRMSFFLWNATPDDQLLKAAQRGDLHTARGRAKAVERMLDSPRLETGVRAFFDDMLGFDELTVLSKDAGIYPAFNGDSVDDAREQTLRTYVDHLLVKNRDYRDLFTTRQTFISPALAVLYGEPAPPGWTPYESPPDSPRVGLLTQISFLAAHAHPGRSSPTLRGKALREVLLCQKVPRPPPNVDFSLLEDSKSVLNTARERLAAHRVNPICAGCHKITDPIGLALENFDGAGQYRDNERGVPIDASGTLDGKNFTDAVGLAEALRGNPAVPACLVKRVYSYGVGGPSDDKTVLSYLGKRFAEQGYKLPDLLRTIATSTAFSAVKPPAAAPAQTVAASGG